MKTVDFPEIQPNSRRVSSPVYPTKRRSMMNGSSIVRQYGSKPTEGSIEVEFKNITMGKLADILHAHNEARTDVYPLNLPAIFWKGVDDERYAEGVRVRELQEANLNWTFNGPVDWESTAPGRATARLRIQGFR